MSFYFCTSAISYLLIELCQIFQFVRNCLFLKKIKISQICTQVKFTLFFVVTCCCNQIVLCTSALQSGNSTKTVKMHPKQIGARVFTESHLMFRSSHFFVFGFWSLLATKLGKYYVIFIYILQGKMGKTEK